MKYFNKMAGKLAELAKDDISSICRTDRRPGGSIDGPIDANGVPTRIANPGIALPALFQSRLELSVEASKYYQSVGRPISAVNMLWPCIKHFRDLLEINKNWKEPETLPEVSTRDISIMKLIELIKKQLKPTNRKHIKPIKTLKPSSPQALNP